MTLTIRMNAARSDVTVQEGEAAPTTAHFDPQREEHRQEVVDMAERRLKQRAKGTE